MSSHTKKEPPEGSPLDHPLCRCRYNQNRSSPTKSFDNTTEVGSVLVMCDDDKHGRGGIAQPFDVSASISIVIPKMADATVIANIRYST
jgi:hypothetical protein